LFTIEGKRKYLTAEEQGRFTAAANAHERAEVRTFCLTLALNTGCRISEALELTPESVDLSDKSITLRTLKQRDKIKYRSFPALTRCSMLSNWFIAPERLDGRRATLLAVL
jgi:integrase